MGNAASFNTGIENTASISTLIVAEVERLANIAKNGKCTDDSDYL